MLLRKLALSVGRLDFWNLVNELTPYEIAVHYAAMRLEPIGEERADIRTALQTLALIQAQGTRPLSEREIQEIGKALTQYTPIHSAEPSREVTPEESAELGKAAFRSIGR